MKSSYRLKTDSKGHKTLIVRGIVSVDELEKLL